MTLLEHFNSYLDNDNKVNKNFMDIEHRDIELNLIYVKKWMKTKHAIMFRLSNKIVQVISDFSHSLP